MVDTVVWLPVGIAVSLGVFFFVQVLMWGFGPLCLKKVWTRIIHFFKSGDVR